MTTQEVIRLLEAYRQGQIHRDRVVETLQAAPVADLGFAQVDTHRALRKGFPEVIYGSGKTPAQVVKISAELVKREQRVLVTRLTPDHATALRRRFRHAVHHPDARCVTIQAFSPSPLIPTALSGGCRSSCGLKTASTRASR